MQYFRPNEVGLSVGDCMPFYKDGVYHLYYLLDEGHHNHPVVGKWGGHQWAHASSSDLVEWTHHPLAIPCDFSREGSICTGSVFFSQGTYHGFYALRPLPGGGEYLCIAKSSDGIVFEKPAKPSFGPPEGYGADFRDPFVFQTTDGLFHMLITSRDHSMPDGLDGCLLHFRSRDLAGWGFDGPFLHVLSRHAPECPDLFAWNGWYYLLFGIGGTTYYRISRNPLGPWDRPVQDMLDCPMVKVMKTAAWKHDRRIGVGWVPSRHEQGYAQFAGQAVFREIVQNQDGTLGTTGVAEMEPEEGAACPYGFRARTANVRMEGSTLRLDAGASSELGSIDGLPADFRLTADVVPQVPRGLFGLLLGEGDGRPAKRILEFAPGAGTVSLNEGECVIGNVEELSQPTFAIEIIVKAGVVDVRIGGRRTLANCFPGIYGQEITFFAASTNVRFEKLQVVSI